jgi:hypothetical protein
MPNPAELRALLLDGREVTDRLLAHLEDPAVEPADVLNLLESLAVVEQRKAPLVEAFRAEASTQRRREDERSIRQYILGALDEIGVPQTAGFLEDYLYARDLLLLKTRGMGALRRDEYRAWDRLRQRGRPRVAYIVPCLDEGGNAVPRWMARSDWPLRSRIVIPGVEELWQIHRVRVLLAAYETTEPEAAARFLPLIEQYAGEAFDHEGGPPPENPEKWINDLGAIARTRIARLEKTLAKTSHRAAASLESLDEAKRLWGRATR